MFGRLTAVRIKAAEDALAGGRLEAAFEALVGSELSDDRRVQRLRSDLAEALLQRGQDHMLGKRFDTALSDFDRAGRCVNVNDDPETAAKVRQWQARAHEAISTAHKARADRDAALAHAKQRIDAGSLVGAAEALADAPTGDDGRAVLSDAIAQRTHRAESALAAARAALKDGHLRLAADKLLAARSLHNKVEGANEVEARLIDQVVKLAVESFKNGRLDRARQELAVLGDELARVRGPLAEIGKAVRLAGDAARALSENRYDRAHLLLGQLVQVGPKAGWVSEVRKQLGVVEDAHRVLLEGPLGLLLGQALTLAPHDRAPAGELVTRPAAPVAAAAPPVYAAAKPAAGRIVQPHAAGLPHRLLLRIDGVGSFLLLRGDRISIGRGGPGSTADLPLISDLAERQAEIVHAGEDYFIVAQTGVDLAGRPVDHALLQDGDRIRLSKRIKLTFRRPSLKSSAAALDLGESVRTAADCRRVILWTGPILMGPTRECHVQLDHRLGGFVLMERGGRLYVKPVGLGGTPTPVVLGEQVAMAAKQAHGGGGHELRLSVMEWSG